MNRYAKAFCLALLAWLPNPVCAVEDQRVVYVTEIDASVDEVWKAFSTSQGLQSWMAPIATIEMSIGGKLKSNYNPEGKIGDETTIESTILAYDPKRMLSLKATKYPKGFAFADAAKSSWSVFYFSELPSSRTKLTIVGLGYTEDEQSQKMRSFFTTANKHSIDQLKKALAASKKEDPASE